MKLLFVTSSLPHALSGHGGGVLLFQTIRQLTKNHEVVLVSFCDREEQKLVTDLKASLSIDVHSVPRGKGAQESFLFTLYLVFNRLFQLVRSLFLWQPYVVSKYYHPRMGRLIKNVTSEKRFDIVQFEYTHMGQYSKFVHHGKIVLDEIDVTYRPAYRLYKKQKNVVKKFFSWVEWCRWKTYETFVIKTCNHVLTITEQDKVLLEWLTKNTSISYFRRGVDIPEGSHSKRNRKTILFLGSFSHQPNVDAARWLVHEIFPQVQKIHSDAICYIIGKNPPQDVIEASKQNTAIKALGFVQDISEYLQSCSIFVAPLRFGGGVKIKTLEAMAHGIPVVTTKIGAEGIDGISSENVILGETAEKIATQICSLFDNPIKAEQVGRNGYENIKHHYSWDVVIPRLEKIYDSILSK